MRICCYAMLCWAAGCGGVGSTNSTGAIDGATFTAHSATSALIVAAPTPTSPSGGTILEVILSELVDSCAAVDTSDVDGGTALASARRMVIRAPLGSATTPPRGKYDAVWGDNLVAGYPCYVSFLFGASGSEAAESGTMQLTSVGDGRDQGSFTFTFGSHGELTGTFDAPRCQALQP